MLKGASTYTARITDTALGTIRAVEHAIQHLEELAETLGRNIADTRKRLGDTQGQVDAPFEYAQQLVEFARRQDEIENALDLTKRQVLGQPEAEQPAPVAGTEAARASAPVTA